MLSIVHRVTLAGPILALALVMALSAGPASAQQASNELLGRMQVRISELERLVQDLTGKVEQTSYENRQIKAQLDNALGDIQYRLNALEGNPTPPQGASMGGQAVPNTGTAPPAGEQGVLGYIPGGQGASADSASTTVMAPSTSILPDAPEAEQYNYAFSMLRRADYAAAEEAFKAFLAQHPNGNLSGNAQYWLGETYYVRGDYEQAAVAFMSGYKTYPQSTKGPDNLLKLGMAMANLSKTKEACAAFGRLDSQYPRAAEAIKRRATAEMGRLGC
ncbi:MAG: tol-pal system protein YbgF [Rhodospirillum sp.]|nr:tol-pal system protein YbgF [Rhodospirillum sp.]MCF8489797.1 tol-pal system protein YbgF [Rhodospirillum sp.]